MIPKRSSASRTGMPMARARSSLRLAGSALRRLRRRDRDGAAASGWGAVGVASTPPRRSPRCAGIRRERASRRWSPPCAAPATTPRPTSLPMRARCACASSALALWRLFVAAFCAMQVMMFATPAYLAAPGEMAPDLRQLLHWGSWVLTLPVLLFSAAPLLQRRLARAATAPHRHGRAGGARPGSHLRGQHRRRVRSRRRVRPRGLLRFAGDVRRLPARRSLARTARAPPRSRGAGEPAFARCPRSRRVCSATAASRPCPSAGCAPATACAWRSARRSRPMVCCSLARRPVDESLLSGESRPLAKRAGDEVLAGSINLGVPVEVRVTRSGAATRQAGIVGSDARCDDAAAGAARPAPIAGRRRSLSACCCWRASPRPRGA